MKNPTRPIPVDATRAFQPSADRGSLWLVGQYDDALRMLRGGVQGRQGLHVLVGEPGTGKTVLAHSLAARLRDEGVVVGRLPYPILEGVDFRVTIAEAFGLPADFRDGEAFTETFRRFIDETTVGGRRVLLIVDEAENLTSDAVRDVRRLLSEGVSAEQPRMSVLLVGHRPLLDALRADGVEPDVLCHLRPLTREQTVDYVTHRLRAARQRRQLFTPSAVRKIWVVSEGIPRTINALCIDALSGLRSTTRRKVTASLVDRAVPDPDERKETVTAVVLAGNARVIHGASRMRPKRRLTSLVGMAGIAAAVVGAFLLTSSDHAPWLSPRPSPTTASPMPASVMATTSPDALSNTDTQTGPESAAIRTELSATTSAPVVPAASTAVIVVPAKPTLASAARPRDRSATLAATRSDQADDPGAMIDWLLKEGRISARVFGGRTE